MEFLSNYEISRTANFIHSGNYSRVALQFPDELLKDSTRVVKALRDELRSLGRMDVGIFVMADTTYGSCCVDEVGASHVDADCVVHYGHTCLSPTTTLPALFIFGKASIDMDACVESLSECLATSGKPVMVLYGLEYAHLIQSISEAMRHCGSKIGIHYAEVRCSVMIPSELDETQNAQVGSFDKLADHEDLQKCDDSCNISKTDGNQISSTVPGMSYSLGGLMWNLPEGHKMEDYLLFWIGSDNSAFANVVLTFNNCEIVRYNAEETCLVKDYSHQKKILMRRYYLVEKAKDANIIGILVGTLGVAGYLHMIHQMKELIAAAGKKAYTLVMGRPNPAKLANFPECDVFIYVSCPQTALFDSKEFLAPVITPFEATLAFSRDRQWTGAYVMEFHDLLSSSLPQVADRIETRYSFFTGGYVEDYELQGEKEMEKDGGELALVAETKKALKVEDENPSSILVKGTAKSVAEYYASRSYHGLDMHSEKGPHSFVVGRMGKASGYIDEKQNHENTL